MLGLYYPHAHVGELPAPLFGVARWHEWRDHQQQAFAVNKVVEWLRDKTVGEVAELAAGGNSEARTAIKILKQAGSKGQQY